MNYASPFKKRFLLIIPIIILFNSCNEPNTQTTNFINIQSDTTWMSLSVREKIGQVICLKYDHSLIMEHGDNSMELFLQRYPVGSFFLASWELKLLTSIDSLEYLYRKTIIECDKATKYPLLFVEDFETGIGSSITKYTELTSEMGLGATKSPKYAYKFGEIIASEARSIGINWLLHPVADLNKNPFNHITNVRSISDDKDVAISILPAQVKGMQTQKVAATAKHFPGDGTDFINQHFNTSSMQLSFERWKQQHGQVFKTLIDSGVMTIMPGHISFPDYQQEQQDGEYLPATLSKELMTGLLKEKLGFNGVIVSDALGMAGIAGYYKNQLETEIECFKAGADILLWPTLEFMDTLEARIERKEISIERLNDAVSRVWNMKKKLGLFEDDYQSIKPLLNSELEQNMKTAYEIAQHSITLVSDKHNQLPLNTMSSAKILLVIITEGDQTDTFSLMQKELIKKGYSVDIQNNLSFFTEADNLESITLKYDKIIFVFYSNPGNPWGTLALNGEQALSMWSANKLPFEKVISVCFGDPYKNYIYMPRTWCRINCYNKDENSQKALVNALTSEFNFTGVSPITYSGAKY